MTNFAGLTRGMLLGMAVSGAALVPAVALAEDGKWVIAFSNSYYGNTMRHQIVETFTAAAEQAKKEGRIADYVVLNGDGSVNTQVAQLNDLILRKVDAIVTIPASEAALNGALGRACSTGIKVVALEAPPTIDCPWKLVIDFAGNSTTSAEKALEVAGGKANVLVVRGVKGTGNDKQAYGGQMAALKKFPDSKIVGEVYGNWSGPEAQAAVAGALPSLPKIDVVFAQGGGDGFGVLQAFQQSPAYAGKLPVIIGGNETDFVTWWQGEKRKNGYSTVSMGPNPSSGSAAFWFALNVLEGATPKKTINFPETIITNGDVDSFGSLQPNRIVSSPMDEAWVKQNLLK